MTTRELYYDFHLLLNKSNEQKTINIEEGNFVRLYNREALRWLSDYIENNNSSDNILNINDLVVRDYELFQVENNVDTVVYQAPKNYFNLIHGDFYSLVEYKNCKSLIFNYIFKPDDANTSKEDKFTRPSFYWERGLAKITNNEIIVYKNDFEIIKTNISYYRQPNEIDIQGYQRLDGKMSTDINPDISDYLCHQILDRVVLEVQREFENPTGFQVSKERERKY